MQHAIARQAEAERERRAKIINAEGEFQAAARLSQAADVIGENPTTIQLRYLQTLQEIGGTNNSTVVFPLPIELVRPFLEGVPADRAETTGGRDETRAIGARDGAKELEAHDGATELEAEDRAKELGADDRTKELESDTPEGSSVAE
jgi:hypothetical protein